MGKTGETKKAILESLSRKSKTLTDLSRELGLAPSTISQHLSELLSNGAIREVDDIGVRKWKYYAVDKGREMTITARGKIAASSIVAIAVAVLAAIILYSNYSTYGLAPLQLSPNETIPVGSTVFSVSDAPPQYNITGLYLTINSIYLRSYVTGKLYRAQVQNATIDLVGLTNKSKIMVGTKVPNGTYDEILLNVTSVKAIVNGMQENVLLPSGKLRLFEMVNISGNTTNWINIDFNLARSLHMLGNGTIIMFPVIKLEQMRGYAFGFNSSRIIRVKLNGTIVSKISMGMYENRSMIRNFSLPGNVTITISKYGAISAFPSNQVQVVIRGYRWIAIQNVQGKLNASGFNVTIYPNGNYLPTGAAPNGFNGVQCEFANGGVYCRAGVGVPSPFYAVRSRIISILENSSAFNVSKDIINSTASGELVRIKSVDINATAGMLSCNYSYECVLVPVTICRNGLPMQSACINYSYLGEYMNYYNGYASRQPVVCPLFVVDMRTFCACIDRLCTEEYHQHLVQMPQ